MNALLLKPHESDPTKSQLLEDAGYAFISERRLYLSRRKKAAFSLQFFENRSAEEITRCLQKTMAHEEECHFFFDEAPTDDLRRQLANLLLHG